MEWRQNHGKCCRPAGTELSRLLARAEGTRFLSGEVGATLLANDMPSHPGAKDRNGFSFGTANGFGFSSVNHPGRQNKCAKECTPISHSLLIVRPPPRRLSFVRIREDRCRRDRTG